MEEKLKNLEPDLLALAEALRDMPWVYAVKIRRVVYPCIHYEMQATMSEDPEGLMRSVVPKSLMRSVVPQSLMRSVVPEHGMIWSRWRDVGPCTLILVNDDEEERAYRAKWGLEPLEAGGDGGHGYGGGKGGAQG